MIKKPMTKIEQLKQREAEFLDFVPNMIAADLFQVFGVCPEEPQSISEILKQISFKLQETSFLLRSYTPKYPMRPHVQKAIAELHAKLALELNDLNLLVSKMGKEQKPCCQLSARLNHPLTAVECHTDLRRLLSRVLDW
jgi:hypothetical protein